MRQKGWKTVAFFAAALLMWQLPPVFAVYRVLLLAMALSCLLVRLTLAR